MSFDQLILFRRRDVERATGYSRSAIYQQIERGLFPKPVALGGRAVAWPAHEVGAMIAARIAGLPDAELRTLVLRLYTDRTKLIQL